GETLPAYYFEKSVDHDSNTETYVALRAEIDNWRWAGVPFYLRTGKSLAQRKSEIVIQFKSVPHRLFPGTTPEGNRLVIRLQPDESISLSLMAKSPGRGMALQEVELDLHFDEAFKRRRWDAYERLLLDVIEGDATLFMRRDEIEAAWRWVDPIIGGWQEVYRSPKRYAAGSWGPEAADSLLERAGHAWFDERGDWSRALAGCGREVGLAVGLAALPQLGQHMCRRRLADQIALHLITALITQERQLAVLLHPFGHYLQDHAVRHGDDGAHYGRVQATLIQLVDEGAVDLQAVDGDVLEIGQRRVTGTEIVHGQLDPLFFLGSEVVRNSAALFQQHALGQLQLQQMGGQTHLLQYLGHLGGKPGLTQLLHRHVHRHPYRRGARVQPLAGLGAGLAKHQIAQLQYQAGFLGDGDEFGGWQH